MYLHWTCLLLCTVEFCFLKLALERGHTITLTIHLVCFIDVERIRGGATRHLALAVNIYHVLFIRVLWESSLTSLRHLN